MSQFVDDGQEGVQEGRVQDTQLDLKAHLYRKM